MIWKLAQKEARTKGRRLKGKKGLYCAKCYIFAFGNRPLALGFAAWPVQELVCLPQQEPELVPNC